VSLEVPRQGGAVSPDGKWWWDGAKWLPMPASGGMPTLGQQAVGAPVYQTPYAAPTVFVYGPKTNSSAVASLVFGILSWFLCPLVGGILAIIFGYVARGQIRRTGESGGGLAIAGLILGYFHTVAFVLVAAFWLIVFGGLVVMMGAIGSIPSPTPSP